MIWTLQAAWPQRFYYLLGNIARLHEAVLAYARDFMINKGFTYAILLHDARQRRQGVMSSRKWMP